MAYIYAYLRKAVNLHLS